MRLSEDWFLDLHQVLAANTKSDLLAAIQVDTAALRGLVSLDSDISSSEKIASLVISLYGSAILSYKSFRELFFNGLPEDSFNEVLGHTNIQAAAQSKRQLARVLSNVPWVPDSQITLVLKKLGLAIEFLPSFKKKKESFEHIVPVVSPPPMFEYQKECVHLLREKWGQGASRCLLQLPTGAGKTKTLVQFLSEYSLENGQGAVFPIVWLAHSQELIEQAFETFRAIWLAMGSDQITLHRVYSRFQHLSFLPLNSVAFCTFESAKKAVMNKASSYECKTLIVDEAHKSVAASYGDVIEKILAERGDSRLVGLTATPGRSFTRSNENRDLANFYEQCLIQPNLGSNPIRTLQNFGVLAKVEQEFIDTGVKLGSELNTRTLNVLAKSVERNKLIVNRILKLKAHLSKILVFSCSLEHSMVLGLALASHGIRASNIDGNQTDELRDSKINQFNNGDLQVLINFGILSTGFDAPKIEGLVITRPTSSIILYSQMLGRALRGPKVGGQEFVKVFDVRDNVDNFGDQEDIFGFFSDYWSE